MEPYSSERDHFRSEQESELLLNFDVLMAIQSFLETVGDVNRMMLTCSILYVAGVKHLLKFTVRPTSARTLRSFCRFALVDFPQRLAFLRSLDLASLPYIGVTAHSTLDMLVKVFTMTGIRNLRWSDCDELGVTTIARMQSPLVSLNVDFYANQERFDPAPILTGVASTLETLELFYMEFEPCDIQLPRLRNLVLHDSFELPMAVLISMFPNLATLNFRNHSSSEEILGPWMEEIRQRNLLEQTITCWSKLELVQCTEVATIYSLGLTCNVRELDTTLSSFEDADKLLEILLDVRPYRLVLDMVHKKTEFACTLLEHAPYVKVLALTITIHPQAPTRSIIRRLLRILKGSTIVALELNIVGHPSYCKRMPELLQPEIEPWVRLVAKHIPSLYYVSSIIGGQYASAWMISRPVHGDIYLRGYTADIPKKSRWTPGLASRRGGVV
ncbi:hypothetical protein OBBRIDRAFT_826328 [Obba rivulosa]|uniref:Uncharacterized protein n=1 Tax=Obba rivulosa TaxID=1052685 RepID=A0A8E2ASF9_9APHY|nr:hypothetical protein OBBRIDRAFT_826328 [Obba rivulosa]